MHLGWIGDVEAFAQPNLIGTANTAPANDRSKNLSSLHTSYNHPAHKHRMTMTHHITRPCTTAVEAAARSFMMSMHGPEHMYTNIVDQNAAKAYCVKCRRAHEAPDVPED